MQFSKSEKDEDLTYVIRKYASHKGGEEVLFKMVDYLLEENRNGGHYDHIFWWLFFRTNVVI